MKPKQVDKYCGSYVAIAFKEDWFNEATQEWIREEEEFEGTLNHCDYAGQERLYLLKGDGYLPTDLACWSANRIKSIRLEEKP